MKILTIIAMFLIGLGSCTKEQKPITPKTISYSISAEHVNFRINGFPCFYNGCETQVLYEGQSVEIEIDKLNGGPNVPFGIYSSLLIKRGVDTVFYGKGPCKTTLKYGQ